MFKVYANGTLLSPAFDGFEEHFVYEPTIVLEPNTIGEFTFNIQSDHPMIRDLTHRTTYIAVYDDAEELFRGRIVDTIGDIYNTGNVYVEGELAFLRDSIYRPFGYSGGVAEFFTALIENHNGQVDGERQFVVGQVTVEDPNDYIVRSSNEALDTLEVIQTRLLDLLGGYIRTRYEDGVRYIDYIADYGEMTGQSVSFRENLLDIVIQKISTNVITCLIPYGAQFEEEQDGYEEEPANGAWDGNRLTIRSVNSGLDYLENAEGINVWGRVWGTATWDDVTEAANLKTKADKLLADSTLLQESIETKTLDLHLTDPDIPRLKCGYWVPVYSPLHDIDMKLQIAKQTIYLDDPEREEVILSTVLETMTDRMLKKEET